MGKTKLNTPEEIEGVLRDYWLTDANMAQIAKARRVSPPTISRIISQHSRDFLPRRKNYDGMNPETIRKENT